MSRRHRARVRTRTSGFALAAFASAMACGGLAFAQTSGGAVPRGESGAARREAPPPAAGDKPPPAVVVPPKLLADPGAEYPKEAVDAEVLQTVEVEIVVLVGPDGRVREAKAQGAHPHGFDAAAEEAGKKLVYEPAKRAGRPVAARVRHKYTFAPPRSRLVGRVFAAESGAPMARARVVVRAKDGSQRSVTTDVHGNYEISDVPAGDYRVSVEGDAHETFAFDQHVSPGEEIASKIRLEAAASAAPTPEGDDDEGVDEVTVRGQKPPREVTKRTLERREMSRIPGTNGDALRSLQNLPGVARPPGLAGLLIVRGSAPNSTQTYVDGAQVPLIYHFGGLSSVVPTELLDKIDFYPGNFSAQYGRVTGGIVDAGLREPESDRLHGMGQIDLIDSRLVVQGPVGKTGWNFAVGGRRSYVDVWLKPILEATDAGVSTAPVYYDGQAILSRSWGKRAKLKIQAYGSDDRIDLLIRTPSASDPGIGGGLSAHTSFWRVQAVYEHHLSKKTDVKLMSASGSDQINFRFGDNYFTLDSRPISGRAELSHQLSRGVTANVGLDMLYVPFAVNVRFPQFNQPGQPPEGPFLSRPPREVKWTDALYRPAMYSELELVPWKGGRVVPGVRVDYAKQTRSWDVGPRMNVRQDIGPSFPRTTLKGGLGLYHEPPEPQNTSPVFGQAALSSQRAAHYSAGFEREFTRHIELSMIGFYKQIDRIIVQGGGDRGTGRVIGLETLLRYKPDERFFGWLAYTLSRSTRQNGPGQPEYLFQFDQTHILTLLGSYRLGRGWEIGGRFRLVSGRMYTPNQYGFYDANAGVNLPLSAYPPFGERMPMFHQLDIRVDKTWQFAAWKLGFYADVLNVYNHSNTDGVSYNYNYTRSTYANSLPIIPSLGLRGEF